jgi:hypothetical protein
MAYIRGFKCFSRDMTCRNNFKYVVGKIHCHDGIVQVGCSGLHFSVELKDVYDFFRNGIYCHVVGSGNLSTDSNIVAAENLHVVELLNGVFISNGVEFHFKDGKLEDRPDGRPAVIKKSVPCCHFYEDGFIKLTVLNELAEKYF